MARRRRGPDRWYPPPSKPRDVEGGIKARSARGAISTTWWSQRFLEVLESIGLGSRLERGRNYARRGQVITLDVETGAVTALVQGSRANPYRVRIGVTAFGKAEWNRAEEALADEAWYAAKLLAGEMPDDIETVFESVGLSLFPRAAGDLSMDCSCPDWEVPCKHLSAVCYLLAEAFDEDPFEILAWRGRDRETLLAKLRRARGRIGAPAEHSSSQDDGTGPVALADCLSTYFEPPADLELCSPQRTRSDAVLDQLPATGLTVRGHELVSLLRPAYLLLDDEQLIHEPDAS
jgi:uncharacterized Zn finger protein